METGTRISCILLAVIILSACTTSLEPVRVRFSYEGGEGRMESMKESLKFGDEGKHKSKKFNLPEKIWAYERAQIPLSFDLKGKKIYGLLQIENTSTYTRVGAVRIEITDEHISKALSGEVVVITVNDPTSQVTIAQLLLGDSPIGVVKR